GPRHRLLLRPVQRTPALGRAQLYCRRRGAGRGTPRKGTRRVALRPLEPAMPFPVRATGAAEWGRAAAEALEVLELVAERIRLSAGDFLVVEGLLDDRVGDRLHLLCGGRECVLHDLA